METGNGWIVGRIIGLGSWSGVTRYFSRSRKGAALAYAKSAKANLFCVRDGHLIEVAAFADLQFVDGKFTFAGRLTPRWRWHQSLYSI